MPRAINALVALTIVAASATAQINITRRDYLKLGNEKYARAEYLAAIEEYSHIKPDAGDTYARGLYNTGVCYYELWRTDDAIVMYRKAIEAANGRYPAASYALGVALEDLKQFTEAKKAYHQAIQTSTSDYAVAHFRLGVIATIENDYHSATRAFKAAISASQTFPASHNNLGVILARKGSLRAAETEFQIALREAEGAFPEAERNLALCRSLSSPTRTELVSWVVIR